MKGWRTLLTITIGADNGDYDYYPPYFFTWWQVEVPEPFSSGGKK